MCFVCQQANNDAPDGLQRLKKNSEKKNVKEQLGQKDCERKIVKGRLEHILRMKN